MQNSKAPSRETTNTVIWAIDPFEKGTRPNAAAAQEFTLWLEGQDAEIQPAHIASSSDADLRLGFAASADEMEKRLDLYVDRLGISLVLPGKVILDDTGSRAGAAKTFLQFAEREGAVAIALSSHGRSGLGRLMMGSFAENVLRESKWPVYFIARNPKKVASPEKGKKRTVLFATDFSTNSRIAFTKFLEKTNLAGCQVILFHSVGFPLPYAPTGTTYVPENYFSEQDAWARQSAAEWIKEAKASGVAAEVIVRDGGAGLVTGNAILKAAKDIDAAMIVMASTSGPLDRSLFGSAAYEVFRSGTCPVLIYGPNSLRETASIRQIRPPTETWAKSGS